jgi:hypothetical protein
MGDEGASSKFERSPVEKLVSDLKVTAGARFNAAARLWRREKSSNVLVSVYSAVLICVSIATFALPLGSTFIRYASFGGIVASILLLVMSMRNFAHQFGVEAEQMHRCALELNELKRRIQTQAPDIAASRLEDYADRYSTILQKWSVNHTQQDFLDYKYKHKWEFEDIASIPDKELPDRRFQEYYSVSAGGVALLTLLGAGFILFLAWILWDSVSLLSTDEATEENRQAVIEQTFKDYHNTMKALEARNELRGTVERPQITK